MLQEITELGVQWHFTEVTVATEEVGEGDFMTEEEEAKQADLYAGLMEACIDLGPEKCITFQTWGISDRLGCQDLDQELVRLQLL